MREHADTIWPEMLRRHAEYTLAHPGASDLPDRRPNAAILACSDARVPPSVILGQEPGSLFVVRLAGNSATPAAIASLTFAVEHLGTDLVIVLGHTGCRAVGAALERTPDATLDTIPTPIDELLATCGDGVDHDAAVAANVRDNVHRLGRDRGPLGRAIAAGTVSVQGGVHDLRTGGLLDVVDGEPLTPSPMTA